MIFIPGSVSCPDLAKADEASFGVEISAEEEAGSQDTGKGESGEEAPASSFDCGDVAVTPDDEEISCGEERDKYFSDTTTSTDKQCLWHFNVRACSYKAVFRVQGINLHLQAYSGWRRQIKFNRWTLPPCQDGSSKGDCCREGPHVLVSKTGYAKKLEAYCGPEAPKFEKTDFEKGKARWLVVFNKTGSDGAGGLQPEIEIESPTIGYRSKNHMQLSMIMLISFIF